METHFKFPPAAPGTGGRSVTVRDPNGHEKLVLAMAADTTCATLSVSPRYAVELYDDGKLVSKVVISKSLTQDQVVTCPAPVITAAPATLPTGDKPEPKVVPVAQTPAQKLSAGLRPTLEKGQVVWR